VSLALVSATHSETISSPIPNGSRLKACWFEDDQIAQGLDFGLALDRDTVEQALRLQHDQYVAQGYMDSHPSGWRLSLHYALPTTRLFVARSGRRVVATMTLIEDSPLGLPMDEIYSGELQGLRDQDRDLAEVSGLALHPDYKHWGVAILLRLIRMLALHATEVAELSDLCIAINPRHAAFYRKAFYFREIGGLRQYGKVNGAPAVALGLDLDIVRIAMSELRAGRPVASDVYAFLFSPGKFESVLARLVRDLEGAPPRVEHLLYFFAHHEAWANALPTDKACLLAACQALGGLKSPGSSLDAPDSGDVLDFRDWVGLALA